MSTTSAHEETSGMIDVGQSVELTHPRARTFLIRDVVNVSDFFARRRRHAPVFYRRRLLEFITQKLEVKVKNEDEQALIEEAVRDMEVNAEEDEEKHQMLRSKSKREYEEEVITREMESRIRLVRRRTKSKASTICQGCDAPFVW